MQEGVYASLLVRSKRFEEAEAQLKKVYELRRAAQDKESAGKVLNELIRLYQLWGQPEKAADVVRRLKDGAPATTQSSS